jgi:hypothetical protein
MPPTTLTAWIEAQAAAARVRGFLVRLAALLFVAALGSSILAVWLSAPDSLPRLLEYEGVAVAGGLVGLAELISRYRDQPLSAVSSGPGLGYIAINALASLGALILIFTFDWKFGATGNTVLVTQLLVASFGAMALFRTSLFTVRAGNQDVGIGPSSLLSIILDACDRGVDRVRAKARAWEVARIMIGVSYEKADHPLPTVATALMQNLSDANQAALSMEVTQLRQATDLSSEAKALLLGLAIADQVGPHVLEAARLTLGDQISEGAAAATPAVASAPEDVTPSATSPSVPGTAAPEVPAGATNGQGAETPAAESLSEAVVAPDTSTVPGTPAPEAPTGAGDGQTPAEEEEPSSRTEGLPQTPQTP